MHLVSVLTDSLLTTQVSFKIYNKVHQTRIYMFDVLQVLTTVVACIKFIH